MKKLFCVLTLFVSMSIYAQESVLLRVNYTKGDAYTIELNTNQDMGELMKMDMTMFISLNVKTQNEINTKVTRVKSATTQYGVTTKFDSDTKEEDLDAAGKMMKAQLSSVVGVESSYKIDELGNTSSFSDQSNKAGELNSVVFPEEAVSVGSSWSSSKDNNGLIMDMTYTVKEISAKDVFLELTGTSSGLAKGTISGFMQIERSTGVTLNSELEMDNEVMGQNMKTKVTIKMIKQ